MSVATTTKQARERLHIHLRSSLYSTLRLIELTTLMTDKAEHIPFFEALMELCQRVDLLLMDNEIVRIERALLPFFPDCHFDKTVYWFIHH